MDHVARPGGTQSMLDEVMRGTTALRFPGRKKELEIFGHGWRSSCNRCSRSEFGGPVITDSSMLLEFSGCLP